MSKRASKPPSPTAWIDTLDLDDIVAAFEEATVDVRDEEEQHVGLITMAQESVYFPFSAKVIGQVVWVVEFNGARQQYRVARRSAVVSSCDPDIPCDIPTSSKTTVFRHLGFDYYDGGASYHIGRFARNTK